MRWLTRYNGAYILKDTSRAPAVTCSVDIVHEGFHVCPISWQLCGIHLLKAAMFAEARNLQAPVQARSLETTRATLNKIRGKVVCGVTGGQKETVVYYDA